MAISLSLSLLLLVALTTTAATLRLTSAAETLTPSQPPSPPQILPPPPSPTSTTTPHSPSPPPTPAAANQDTHLKNILDALIGTGDYGGWANLLSSANPSDLPLTATLFIPSNDAISGLLSASTATSAARLDPLLVPYHIVPQRLTFSELQGLENRTRLPTLLLANFIVVTDNSPASFTVDGSQITQADIFLNAAFALHGVNRVLNYSVFGGGGRGPLPPPPENNSASLLRRKRMRPRGITVGARSGAWRSCAGIPVIVSSFFVLFMFKIL